MTVSRNQKKRLKSTIQTIFFLFWLTAIGTGIWNLARYANEPGQQALPPADFPSIGISGDPAKPVLVMLAHPRCPCTRASLVQLSELMARHGANLNAFVLFYQPSSEDAGWSRGELWQMAEDIPHVTVRADFDAAATRLLGAHTSGQTLVYSAQGKLIFKGGITAGRGHSGENSGRRAIEELLEKGSTEKKSSFVFGCAITGDEIVAENR